MSLGPGHHPPVAFGTWVAAIHISEDDYEPLGAGVVVDTRRVLTCAHVIIANGVVAWDPLWVSFPAVENPIPCPRRRVARYVVASGAVWDVALLELDEDVPAGVQAAPLRRPKPSDVVGKQWWAFGFPDRDPYGESADGLIGAALAYGWVRLDTTSRYMVRPGFSGGGLWSADYGSVVAVIGQAHGNGDGRAITLHQADLCLPQENLARLTDWSAQAAGEVAMAAWGWTLSTDPEGVRHWRPRARGVSVDSERGFRFRGRTAALDVITRWLDRPVPDRRVLAVTGSPGVGKSAVLGRVVTTSDATIRAGLPDDDDAVRAEVGSVGCAVHAKGKTALEVASEIARAASAALPTVPGDLAPMIRDALEARGGRRFNVIIDALDEAASPAQARVIAAELILPLAETCSDVGAQVVVGTRRFDDGGSLLDVFADALTVVDLDDSKYFEEADLAAYALACLQLVGDERHGNPYSNETVARPVARRIAELADHNFLIAGLVARGHGLHDEEAALPAQIGFDATVSSVLAGYLERISPIGGLTAIEALTCLAFAEAPGLPAILWEVVAAGLYDVAVKGRDLARFARSAAANFLVDSSAEGTAPTFRLFHQALDDALLAARSHITLRVNDERDITQALVGYGRSIGWPQAPDYLLRSLPGHAAAAGLIDTLLTDDEYPLHADLWRLMLAAGRATSREARLRVQLMGLTQESAIATSSERAALFSVTDVVEHLDSGFDDSAADAPYRARWAQARSQDTGAAQAGHQGAVTGVCAVTADGRELLASVSGDHTVRIWDPATGQQRATLQGHQGWVRGICAVTVSGQNLLASAGDDQTVRIWDPATGQQRATLQGHQGRVSAVCPVTIAGQELLASASSDQTVRIWDPATGQQRATLQGHQGWVRGICAVTVSGQNLLASAGDDQTVRIWDPATGQQRATLQGHQGWVRGICAVTVSGQNLLASASSDQTVRIWDPATGQQRATLQGHQGWVRGVCPVTIAGQELLASASDDQTVRIWDPATGQQRATLQGHQGWVRGVCPVTIAGRELLASASGDQTVRIWDPATGQQRATLHGHRGPVHGVCAVTVTGRELLASASDDQTIRIWDPATGQQRATLHGHRGPVHGVCPVTIAGQELLASASDDQTIRIWDPATGQQRATLQGHRGPVHGVCPVTIAGQELLGSASDDQTIRIWDPATGQQRATLQGHQGRVTGVCPVTIAGQELLASASDDQTIRIWDPATGQQRATLQGHRGPVRGVCAVIVTGRELLASTSDDQDVRIWNPATGRCLLAIPTHHRALAAAPVGGQLALGLAVGLLLIEISSAMSKRRGFSDE